MSRLDDLRREWPDLGFAVYAMDPSGPVTLEVLAEGNVFTFTGASEDEVLERAFPRPPPDPPPAPGLFE